MNIHPNIVILLLLMVIVITFGTYEYPSKEERFIRWLYKQGFVRRDMGYLYATRFYVCITQTKDDTKIYSIIMYEDNKKSVIFEKVQDIKGYVIGLLQQ